MRRICFVTTGLRVGGAEVMLYQLLRELDHTRFEPHVISLLPESHMARPIRDLGVPVESVGMRRGGPVVMPFLRLVRRLRHGRFDLIQAWMYHANLLAGIASLAAGRPPVVWGIHHSNLSPELNGRVTLAVIQVGAWLSTWLPDAIVACGHTPRDVHVDAGYDPDCMEVIPNGFDTDRFAPAPRDYADVRKEIGADQEALLVGNVARFDPQKDHRTLIDAIGQMRGSGARIHFLLAGSGVTEENERLTRWIHEADAASKVSLLGRRDDVTRLMAALDVYVSSSRGEGFPMTIGEAMSSGVPCVVTDVGDSRRIVGSTGRTVPPADPDALADAITELVTLSDHARWQLGAAGRTRIVDEYSLETVVRRYESCYERLCSE